MTEIDGAYMRRALRLARHGWGQTAPNPLVGAVVVRDGEVIGEGYHARFGADHAEVVALRAAGDRALGSTLYVSLEPCAHHGQTPPCVDAILAAGVARVVAAIADPNPLARGGLARLAAAGVATETGAEEPAARELNAAFFHAVGARRPWITLKLALSLDGALADTRASRGWITNTRSRAMVQRMRAAADAIGVGVGTVVTDDPLLTVRGRLRPRIPPVRLIFDRTARVPLASRVVRTAREVPVLVVAEAADPGRARALEAAGVEVMPITGLDDAWRQLRARGVGSLLVEGGARMAGALLGASVVDRLVIFQAPTILGAGAANAFAFAPPTTVSMARRWRAIERRRLGDDTMTTYALD